MCKSFFHTIVFLTVIMLSSCSTYKTIPYFQNLDKTKITQEEIKNFAPLKIQAGDILGIVVGSLNPDAWTDGNKNGETALGYKVDQAGNISLPLVGLVKVANLTTEQAREVIESRLVKYLKSPAVNLSILNFKISVLGDVNRPNVYPITSEQVSITEALSLAGDLQITGMRQNILLIREQDGVRKYIPVDLTSTGLFQSEYYYLRNNDIIYVTPDKNKAAAVDQSARNVGFVLSAISILTLIATQIL